MKTVPTSSDSINLRPYKIKDLAALYNTTTKTFRKWLIPFKKDIGERQGHFYSILQVKIIFKKLSFPQSMDEE